MAAAGWAADVEVRLAIGRSISISRFRPARAAFLPTLVNGEAPDNANSATNREAAPDRTLYSRP